MCKGEFRELDPLHKLSSLRLDPQRTLDHVHHDITYQRSDDDFSTESQSLCEAKTSSTLDPMPRPVKFGHPIVPRTKY
ncbi:uncharacterized protein PHALS_06629 [Plasmopara halstedii]|uniref:Uncharacterized protein n=1 Tax=Plasmopara halstedii TaxID=4781 RepID=A0A0P1B407_PLAHL|nr:uncharacterized protein PHALS_06629 [Plasmopara halstedii]CEG48829.1 hypothetical protein PHALS_06629 [Plasmopara halstedii]|eukprot:XP_024585198.1 hypothetical protein PHALS_06629 [Plasmopara halstedii]